MLGYFLGCMLFKDEENKYVIEGNVIDRKVSVVGWFSVLVVLVIMMFVVMMFLLVKV